MKNLLSEMYSEYFRKFKENEYSLFFCVLSETFWYECLVKQ